LIQEEIWDRPSIKIAGASILAPLSVLLQGLPPIFLTPWFMRVDFAAVPWILCWTIFGWKSAILCLLISAPLVGLLGPFAGGWVGAIMKSVASIWMFMIPALFATRIGSAKQLLDRRSVLISSAILALVVRVIVTVFFNFYFALPIFFNMDHETIIQFFSNPMFQSFISTNIGVIGLSAFIIEIAFWNIIQGSIDLFSGTVIGSLILKRFFKTSLKD